MKITVTTTTHLLDHDAAEVAMLEGTEGRVLLRQDVGQLYVEGVQCGHFLQGELCLLSPVCWHVPRSKAVHQ